MNIGVLRTIRRVLTDPEWRPWWEVRPGVNRALRVVLAGFVIGVLSGIAAIVLAFVLALGGMVRPNGTLVTVIRVLQWIGDGCLVVTVGAAFRACRRRKRELIDRMVDKPCYDQYR